jgi:hypothetical protein
MLVDGIVFIGCQTATLQVIVNDTFAYSCADCETMGHDDIEPVFAAYVQHGYDGVVAWACKRRGKRPLPPYIEDLRKRGLWTAEMEAMP